MPYVMKIPESIARAGARNSLPDIAPSGPKKKNGACKLLITKRSKDRYDYKFDTNYFLVSSEDNVLSFEVVGDGPTLGNALLHCYDYCATTTRKDAVVPVKYDDSTSVLATPYEPATKAISLRITPDSNELILIGIVIKIHDTMFDPEPFYLLCDPQVGNGPPKSGFHPAYLLKRNDGEIFRSALDVAGKSLTRSTNPKKSRKKPKQ